MKYLSFVLILISFISCDSPKDSQILFDKTTEITGEEYKNEIISSFPIEIGILDSCILLLGPDYKNIMQILRIQDATKIRDWGRFGPGPDEMITPFLSKISAKDSSVWLYDMSLNTLNHYKWQRNNDSISLYKQSQVKYDDAFTIIRFVHKLDNGFSVATTLTGQKKLLVLLDKNLNIVENFGDFPDNKNIVNFTPYMGYFASYENKFVYIMQNLGYIVEYEISKEGKISKRWEHFLSQPIYINEEGRLNKNENIKGFYDVEVTEKYVFCSYSGIKMSEGKKKPNSLLPKTLLVFDHSGKPIKKFTTNKDIGRFCLSEDGNVLYGFYFFPEVGIAKYNLSSFLP